MNDLIGFFKKKEDENSAKNNINREKDKGVVIINQMIGGCGVGKERNENTIVRIDSVCVCVCVKERERERERRHEYVVVVVCFCSFTLSVNSI